ncbi:MAG: gamma-glutamylcyclotransferase [Cyanobacteria bacterium J06633_2]
MTQDLVKVFVYGTLKPGEFYYSQYCEGHVVETFTAIAYGTLFDLPMGYPAMTLGDRPVHGVVLCFENAACLSALDELEDYVPGRSPEENEYNRRQVNIFSQDGIPLGSAWTYIMDTAKALALGGAMVSNGTWTAAY